MGNCISDDSTQPNLFKVRNINDNRRLVHKGMMEVTVNDLLYTDSKSKEKWQWPLKYLRKYGCDGNVFSFEAGRKCPGGEGLYAFSTPRASQLFDLVARNITNDNAQGQGESTSPLPLEGLSPSEQMSFPHRNQSVSAVPAPSLEGLASEVHNYHNIGPNGPVVVNVHTDNSDRDTTNASHQSPGPKPDSPGTNQATEVPTQYREVVFDKPPELHPMPTGEMTQRTSYSKINFDETQKYNLERKNGTTLQLNQPMVYTHSRSRTSTTSTSSATSEREKERRVRMNSVPASSSKHSISSGSLSSQTSLTENLRDNRTPRANGGVPQSAGTTYQNVVLGTTQPNYQNVNVGCGDASNLTSPNYENLHLTSTPTGSRPPNYGRGSCPPSRSTSASSHFPSRPSLSVSVLSPGDASAVPLPSVHGAPMGHYAELSLSSSQHQQRTSTPQPHAQHHQPSYMQLEFSSANPTPNHSTVVTTPPLLERRHSPEATRLELQPVPAPTSSATTSTGTIPILVDEKVNYGVLDFPMMKAIGELQEQREKENLRKEREREKEKEKEKTSTHHRRHTQPQKK